MSKDKKSEQLEKAAKKIFSARLEKAAPKSRKELEEQAEKFLRAILQDDSIDFELSIWKGDVLFVYSKNVQTDKQINQDNYLKFWGFPMVAVRSKDELPNDAPWAIDKSKPDSELRAKALSAFQPGDYMSVTSAATNIFNLIFDMKNNRTFRCGYDMAANCVSVSCSQKKDATRLNKARLTLFGTPIRAEYKEDLTGDIAEEMASAEMNYPDF